jgi:cellobiose phosphorylase
MTMTAPASAREGVRYDRVGHYTDGGRVFRITNMYPKRPLYNFLWNEHFIARLDQFGGGQSWHYRDEVRTTMGVYENARLVYVRDNTTGQFWCANRNFNEETFDEFYCEVGLGWSRIVSAYRGVRVSLSILIPSDENAESWSVQVENLDTSSARDLSLYLYAGSGLNETPHPAYNHGVFDEALNGVALIHKGYDEPYPFSCHYFATDAEVDAYETTNRRFRGVYGQWASPLALRVSRLASEGTSFDDTMAAVLQFDRVLAAGDGCTLAVANGLAVDTESAREAARRLLEPGYWSWQQERLGEEFQAVSRRYQLDIPEDPEVSTLLNIWVKQQIALGKTWARTYTRGFRDIMQDVTAYAALDPEGAREKILYCLGYQKPDGNSLRQWEPIDPHPYRDGPAWIVPAVAGVAKESGDFAFLDHVVGYYGSEESGTVLDHCRRGLSFLNDNLGPHGLCLWGGGDWNDSLNGAGLQGVGESVWLTEAAIAANREFERLLEHIGRADEATAYAKSAESLSASLNREAWDGDHYLCGFTDWGEKVGSNENAEGSFFLNMQTWGVLCGAADDPHALMDRVEQRLSSPFGHRLNTPCFTRGDDHIGRVSYFEPGAYENGSVYNHGVAFKIVADCLLGRAEQAFDSVRRMLPSNPDNPAAASGVEPYAVTNMYLGPDNPGRAGESLMGWITGTAGWLFRGVTEFIVGVQADYDGLRVRPCLPQAWRELNVRREFRNAVYEIRFVRAERSESSDIRVDGKPLEGDLLPVFGDGQVHHIEVSF